ncbi:methyl-accepting chemotaxis protein [Stappia stellulata]|uniref:methyl-accepting chemotaxis protein n=1 Tax=Stappia stellulata TaxID=71235 RepID=UPI001CD77FBB|nr:methyl-accepting chemotaxis protein [Stappia stellulata]MCA1242290.1 methyl-accepting chemotaxis protein [Stappia stellulata]
MKNLSISSKGLLSYSLMAATGVVVCLFMFLSADGANDSVKRYEKVNASVVANQVLKAEISYQATSLKNFMLSGDRKWVGEVDKAADVINATFETLNQQLQAGGASQTASLSQLRGEWDAWYREYALQQIDYMRNSRTVELAKAIEATGEGDRSLQVVYDTHARVRGLLAEELKTLASEQAEKLALMKNVAVFGGAVFLTFAAIFGWINFALVARPIKLLARSTASLAKGNTSVDLSNDGRKDEVGDLLNALIVFKDNLIERNRLSSERETARVSEAERQKRVEDLIEEFRVVSGQCLDVFSTNSGQLQSAATTMCDVSGKTAERTILAAERSSSAADNVEALAAASEQMSASIAEIEQQISNVKDLVQNADSETRETDQKISGLSEAAGKIGDVVSLIQAIAEQTNLLALNATIEAARAGEAGRGFAVVAAEVKELAEQTAKATDEIRSQVEGIQTQTSDAVSAIKVISGTIAKVNEFTVGIVASIEEQSASTQEINRNVTSVSGKTQEVSEAAGQVSDDVRSTLETSQSVMGYSKDVATEAERLSEIVDRFLAGVKAA